MEKIGKTRKDWPRIRQNKEHPSLLADFSLLFSEYLGFSMPYMAKPLHGKFPTDPRFYKNPEMHSGSKVLFPWLTLTDMRVPPPHGVKSWNADP